MEKIRRLESLGWNPNAGFLSSLRKQVAAVKSRQCDEFKFYVGDLQSEYDAEEYDVISSRIDLIADMLGIDGQAVERSQAQLWYDVDAFEQTTDASIVAFARHQQTLGDFITLVTTNITEYIDVPEEVHYLGDVRLDLSAEGARGTLLIEALGDMQHMPYYDFNGNCIGSFNCWKMDINTSFDVHAQNGRPLA